MTYMHSCKREVVIENLTGIMHIKHKRYQGELSEHISVVRLRLQGLNELILGENEAFPVNDMSIRSFEVMLNVISLI